MGADITSFVIIGDVTGDEVRQARLTKGWTQADLAKTLGVSQAYVSLLESNRRPVADRMSRKLVSALGLPASALPVTLDSTPLHADGAARALGALGYGGFARMHATRKLNPAELLVRTLRAPNVEGRLVEAMPWLLVNHPRLDWEWLLSVAKQNDLQNRLGFVVTLARELAETRKLTSAAQVLRHWERVLERSRLQREEAFAADSLTDAERTWLRRHRSKAAARWNILTNISADSLARGV